LNPPGTTDRTRHGQLGFKGFNLFGQRLVADGSNLFLGFGFMCNRNRRRSRLFRFSFRRIGLHGFKVQ